MSGSFKAPIEWNWPLSGAVSVPVTMPSFNVNLGGSGNPALEQDLLNSVGSYGRQIGWLCDAVEVLAARLDRKNLTHEEEKALDRLNDMAATIRFRKALRK